MFVIIVALICKNMLDVGLSRSTDGGKTWEKMRLPLSFGEYGGLPKAQNGVGILLFW